jgi:predicted dehydrogenase
MAEFNVGIIGCGWVSNGHIKAWRKVKDAKVVSVCDVFEDAAKSMAMKWNIDEYYVDFSELIEKSAVDVVDICTPPSTHREFMVRAMKGGINAITEKPMTMTVEEAQDIVDVKNQTGMKAGVIHNWLYEPTILQADSMVEDGRLGDIIHVEVEALNTKSDSMAANKDHWSHGLVGGRISEMLPHPIYLIRRFLGPEITVESVQVSKIGEYPWMRSDELSVIFRAGEKMGRAYASFNSPREAIFVNLYGKKGHIKTDVINATLTSYPERHNERFSKGMDSIKQAAQLTGSTLRSAARIATGTWNTGVDTIIQRYADALRRGEEPPVTVEEGLEVTRTLEEMALMIDEAEKNRVLEV